MTSNTNVTACDCGSHDLNLCDLGVTDSGESWNEYECQDCGSIFFDPPIASQPA